MMEPASQNRTVEASQLEVSMSQRWPRPYSAEGELDLQHNSRHSLGVNRTSSGLARKLMRIFCNGSNGGEARVSSDFQKTHGF